MFVLLQSEKLFWVQSVKPETVNRGSARIPLRRKNTIGLHDTFCTPCQKAGFWRRHSFGDEAFVSFAGSGGITKGNRAASTEGRD